MIVQITYLDGSTDLKEVLSVDEICLDGVDTIKVIAKRL